MKLLIVTAALILAAGYFRMIPALSPVAEMPMALMAGGAATICMVYLLTRVEP